MNTTIEFKTPTNSNLIIQKGYDSNRMERPYDVTVHQNIKVTLFMSYDVKCSWNEMACDSGFNDGP